MLTDESEDEGVREGYFKLREQHGQRPGGGNVWDFLEESMCGSVLNVTRSQSRNRSDKRAELERWAGPVLGGALDPSLTSQDVKATGGFNQRGLTREQHDQLMEWGETRGERPVRRSREQGWEEPSGGA